MSPAPAQGDHRNSREVTRPATSPQASSTAHCAHGQPPETRAVRIASPRAPDGNARAMGPRTWGSRSVGRRSPRPRRTTQMRLARARVASARSVPARRSASATNVPAPRTRLTSAGSQPARRGVPAEDGRERPEDENLDDEDRPHGHRLPQQQPAAAERGDAEQPENAVAAVEPGRDGLPGEGGRDDGQGEHSRRGVVDAATRSEGGRGRQSQPDEGHPRQDDRDEELLAVAQQGQGLEDALRPDPRPRLGGPVRRPGGRHRSPLPVRSK